MIDLYQFSPAFDVPNLSPFCMKLEAFLRVCNIPFQIIEEDEDLLGLYQGLPIDKESFFQAGGQLPAKISIYRGPILRLCRTKKEVVQEVRDTVVHEIGHHFGFDDDEMPY